MSLTTVPTGLSKKKKFPKSKMSQDESFYQPNSQVKGVDLPYKTVVDYIIDHKTSNRTGVKFYVRWKHSSIVDLEHSSFIMTKPGGIRSLQVYLHLVAARSPIRLTWMMRRQSNLAELLQDDRED